MITTDVCLTLAEDSSPSLPKVTPCVHVASACVHKALREAGRCGSNGDDSQEKLEAALQGQTRLRLDTKLSPQTNYLVAKDVTLPKYKQARRWNIKVRIDFSQVLLLLCRRARSQLDQGRARLR